MDLSLIIPTYQDEHIIEPTLAQADQYLTSLGLDYEIIPVVDGSPDHTGNKVRAYASVHPTVKPIIQSMNKGKGYVVSRGMLAGQGKYLIFTDSDLSTPLNKIPKMLQHLKTHQVVIGSRYLPGSRIIRRQPIYRHIGSRLFNLVVQALILPGIWDTQCGFKGVSRVVAPALFAELHLERFTFDLEVLVRARELGFSIMEMPVSWTDSPSSSVKPFQIMSQVFADIVMLRKSLSKGVL